MAILGAIAIINRIIDPFYYYRDIEIKGINEFKPKAGRYERHIKPALLIQNKPNALIFGNSISEIAFNPDNKYFNNSGSLSGYNFSFAESPWEKVFCHFEFATKHTSIKRALIGISLDNMPIINCETNESYKRMGAISHKDILLTGSALNASFQTILEQKNKVNSHSPNGMYFYARGKGGVKDRFKNSYQQYIKNNATCNDNRHLSNTFSTEIKLEGLKQLIDLAQKNNIELTVFIYPEHAYTLEIELMCNTFDARLIKLKQIASIMNGSVHKKKLRLWHFFDYNSITTENIKDKMIYWQDSFHVNYEMGDLMLEDMYSEKQKRVGTEITHETSTDELKIILNKRKAYLSKNPLFHKNLSLLLP